MHVKSLQCFKMGGSSSEEADGSIHMEMSRHVWKAQNERLLSVPKHSPKIPRRDENTCLDRQWANTSAGSYQRQSAATDVVSALAWIWPYLIVNMVTQRSELKNSRGEWS